MYVSDLWAKSGWDGLAESVFAFQLRGAASMQWGSKVAAGENRKDHMPAALEGGGGEPPASWRWSPTQTLLYGPFSNGNWQLHPLPTLTFHNNRGRKFSKPSGTSRVEKIAQFDHNHQNYS